VKEMHSCRRLLSRAATLLLITSGSIHIRQKSFTPTRQRHA
jgi:hypothetical protein